MSRYYTKSGCIWLFVSLYFTQYINLVDTAIQLQTCSGRFPSPLSVSSLALVIVTERLRALRLLTLEQVSPLPTLFPSHSSGRSLLVAATVPQPHLVHLWLQNLIAIYIHFGTLWFFGTLLFVLCLFAGPRAGFHRWLRSARVENGLPVYAQ